ncbi:ABC transporter substrate-binding protein [Desulfosporosinus lacus]|uniref:Branched-chain amino acid transport system substrate-binding protein n=1 Tax=Desulfosporosinus lacus DSM 15449 TaxID=1121420 RepID=A0A1M5QX76_9FIRM|nr:ABC transporter substrate-binding protein [Desulfosporosinus lacus]SHH18528.1 branched-chain amino acid transport system substrate-binding protein [Desulfosporosinus lacus DSM 15449]
MSLQADKWPNQRAARGNLSRKQVLGWGLICFILLSLMGCASEQKVNPKELYIPVLGDAAWLKEDGAFISGVELAVEVLNKEYTAEGYTVKTEVIDDLASYDKGVEMATRLSTEKTVTAVINLQDFDVSKTTAGILSEGGKLVFFPYGVFDSLMNQGNNKLFCNVPSFADLGTAMAGYAAQKGFKRIAIYHNGITSQEELATAFELALSSTEGKVVDYVPNISSQSDFETVYSRWKALDVDCVVIAQYGSERAYEVLGMIRNKDNNLAVIGEPIFSTANLLSENKKNAENLVIPSTLIIKESEKLNKFREQYRQKFNKEADIWAVQGYDTMRLITDTCINTGCTDPEILSEILHAAKGYEGVGGTIAFLEGGALKVNVQDLQMLVSRNGQFAGIKN